MHVVMLMSTPCFIGGKIYTPNVRFRILYSVYFRARLFSMILVRDHRFFAAILSQMDLVRVDGNVRFCD